MISSAFVPAVCQFPAGNPTPTTQPAADPSRAKAVMDPTSLAALIGGIIIVAIIGTVAVQTNRDTNHDDRPLFARKQP